MCPPSLPSSDNNHLLHLETGLLNSALAAPSPQGMGPSLAPLIPNTLEGRSPSPSRHKCLHLDLSHCPAISPPPASSTSTSAPISAFDLIPPSQPPTSSSITISSVLLTAATSLSPSFTTPSYQAPHRTSIDPTFELQTVDLLGHTYPISHTRQFADQNSVCIKQRSIRLRSLRPLNSAVKVRLPLISPGSGRVSTLSTQTSPPAHVWVLRRALSLPELSRVKSQVVYSYSRAADCQPDISSQSMAHTSLLENSSPTANQRNDCPILNLYPASPEDCSRPTLSPRRHAQHRSYGALRDMYSGRLHRRSDDGDSSHTRSKSFPIVRKARSHSTLQSAVRLQPNIEFGIGDKMTFPPELGEVVEPRPRISDLECSPMDPNFDSASEDSLLLSPSSSSTSSEEHIQDDSPFALVRASVASTDDISLSINTPRMWFLSLLFAIAGSSTNMFFSLRYPSVSITPMIALLLTHPLGLAWDGLLKYPDDPKTFFVNGTLSKSENTTEEPYSSWKRSFRLWLAQGQWNGKEHACVYISSNVSFGFAFATDLIVEQTMFYKQDFGPVYQILLVLSTQILGYSLAGLTRQFLVYPTGMLWPQALNTASMFSTLHKSDNPVANGWTISKYRFFIYVFLGSFAFYFLPGLLFPALSYFNVITWFAPDNVVVSNLFGVVSGLGLFPVTFDWAQIAYIGSPLIVPLWAAANVIVGIGIVIWLIAPVLYYSNYLYSAFMPILSASVFDDTGHVYDVSKILTKDLMFDQEGYDNYSRVYLPITYVLSYFGQFAGLAALLTNTFLWHGDEIWGQLRANLWTSRSREGYQPVDEAETSSTQRPRTQESSTGGSSSPPGLLSGQDVHNRLMQRYEDVPLLWYILTGIFMAAIGIYVVEFYPIFLPWYGLLLALIICVLLFLPIAIVHAVANQHISIYLICQLVCGVFFPGKPLANMVFTTYGYITTTQAVKFTSDLKLGHYMKVPPKILFTVQLIATVVSSLTQLGVLNWMLANVYGICTSKAINGFTCPIARVHFNGSILWGVVGPTKFFGADGLYRHLLWAFPFGACLPFLTYFAYKRTKRPIFKKTSFPIMFSALSWIPPTSGINFSVWALVCWLFNDVLKHNAFEWWSKYNMTLSAALDSGLAAGVCVIFFAFIYPGWMDGFSWWGTEVYKQGCDWKSCSFKQLPPGGHFGS